MSAAEQQGPGIPDKLYFKIGEVCEITGVKQHVLRYWESEFRILAPQRANSRQRLYRRSDVENILRIKRLLKEEGFTISGAKKLLARERKKGFPGSPIKLGHQRRPGRRPRLQQRPQRQMPSQTPPSSLAASRKNCRT